MLLRRYSVLGFSGGVVGMGSGLLRLALSSFRCKHMADVDHELFLLTVSNLGVRLTHLCYPSHPYNLDISSTHPSSQFLRLDHCISYLSIYRLQS